ncbi:LOW QUALITY PROTEIN: tagatose-6-phosphate kinase, partial [Streptomyces sp. SPB78]
GGPLGRTGTGPESRSGARRHLRLQRAPPGTGGRRAPGRRDRHGRPDRGDVEPGGPVRRLHRAGPGGLPRPGARPRRPPRAAARTRRARRRPPRPEPLARPPRAGGHGRGGRPGPRLCRGGLHQDPPRLQLRLRRGEPPAPRCRGGPAGGAPRPGRRGGRGRGGGPSALRHRHRGPGAGRRRPRPRRCTAHPRPAAGKTLKTHRAAFAAAGLGAAWERVMALVVQPGVEFGQRDIADYRGERTRELRHVLDEEPGMVFEAHSTDYQLPGSLARLVRDHWAVLKVGPALTFALREALFALAAIEEETVGTARSGLVEVVDRRMCEEPGGWAGYSSGSDARALRLDRLYGYSDRVRYYWTDPEIAAAQRRLFENLGGAPVPLALLSAHLPAQYARVRSGVLAARPHDLVIDRVRDVLRTYAAACAPRPKEYA